MTERTHHLIGAGPGGDAKMPRELNSRVDNNEGKNNMNDLRNWNTENTYHIGGTGARHRAANKQRKHYNFQTSDGLYVIENRPGKVNLVWWQGATNTEMTCNGTVPSDKIERINLGSFKTPSTAAKAAAMETQE